MLEIKKLICGYNKGFYLNNINFKINNGEFVGILGPNGSGKTTLFRAITKILPIKKSQIFLNTKDIKEMTLKDLAKELAVVSQSIEKTPDYINVFDYILMGRSPHRKLFQFVENRHDIEIAQMSMLLTNVFDFKERPISELSGGERQRVFVSRAIAQEPKILLLDEPTTYLDIGHQIELLDLLKKLNKTRKITVIVILHDLNLAGIYCDRLILMNNGEIYKDGAPEEVLTYENIENVYKTLVVVEKSPITKKPYVFVIPRRSYK